MPQIGESSGEGTITRWLKKPGETVKRDEPLFEISTDKVDAEIPAPAAGVLLEIKFPEGTTVAINTVVAVLGEVGEASATPASPSVAAPVATPKPVAPSPAPPAAPAVSAAPAPAQEPASLDEVRLMRSSPVVRAIAQEKGIDIS